MAIGIYKAFRRRGELDSTLPTVFTNNLQVWLSIFAFTTFIAGFFFIFTREELLVVNFLPLWLLMFSDTAVAGIGLILFVCFGVLSIYAFCKLVAFAYHSLKGVLYRYNSKTLPSVLCSINPLENATTRQEYLAIRRALAQHNKQVSKEIENNTELIAQHPAVRGVLTKHNKQLSREIEHNSKLIARYSVIIEKMKGK